MVYSKLSVFCIAAACILLGMPIGSIVGYAVRGGYASEFPIIAAYSYFSPILLVSPAGYSSEGCIYSLTGLLLSGGAIFAYFKNRWIWGLLLTSGAVLAVAVNWGMRICDALSA